MSKMKQMNDKIAFFQNMSEIVKNEKLDQKNKGLEGNVQNLLFNLVKDSNYQLSDREKGILSVFHIYKSFF